MFSKSCKYGIRAVLYLAVNTKKAGKKIGVAEIAAELDVPKHFLAKILQELSRQNLISSTKGPKGGFFLSEKNIQEPLLRIIESIDGPQVMGSCILGLPVCSSETPCPLHEKSTAYREGLLEIISNQNIENLAESIIIENLTL